MCTVECTLICGSSAWDNTQLCVGLKCIECVRKDVQTWVWNRIPDIASQLQRLTLQGAANITRVCARELREWEEILGWTKAIKYMSRIKSAKPVQAQLQLQKTEPVIPWIECPKVESYCLSAEPCPLICKKCHWSTREGVEKIYVAKSSIYSRIESPLTQTNLERTVTSGFGRWRSSHSSNSNLLVSMYF